MQCLFLRQWRAMPQRVRRRVAFGATAGSGVLMVASGLAGATLGFAAAGSILALAALGAVGLSQVFVPQWSRLSGLVSRCPTADRIALTFDDGPDPRITPRLLDLLAQHRARGTFFFLGGRARAHPSLVRATAEAGHEVAIHGYSHEKVWRLPKRAFQDEVTQAVAVIADLAGRPPRWYRAPHGFLRPDQAHWLARRGLRVAGWSIGVWDTDEQADPQVLAARLESAVRGGDILLLHDGVADRDRAQEAMLAALAEVLPQWLGAGLQATTLSDAVEPLPVEDEA